MLTYVRICAYAMAVSALLFSCKKNTGEEPEDPEEPPAELNACGFRGWPTTNTAGLPKGASLTIVTKDLRTTEDGQVIENIDMRARIYVRHKDVIIRNCLLSGDYYYAVYVEEAAMGGPLLIENCDITGGITSGDNVTIRNNHIYAAAGKFKNDGLLLSGSNMVIENNLIHNLRGNAGAHIDGIQIMSGNNITIRNNWVEVSDNPETGEDGGPTAAIFVHVYQGSTSNVAVECNMIIMKDGWYPLRLYDVSGMIVVRHNRWRHGANNDVPVDIDSPGAAVVWENNEFEDGIPIQDPTK